MQTTIKPYVVGVDIGGQSTKIGVVDRAGIIINQTIISSLYKRGEASIFINSLCDTIRSLVDINLLQGIGIGAPNANYYTGIIEDAVHLEWTKGEAVYVTKEVSERLNDVRVVMTNDANAAAMGEMMYGVAKGMRNFIVITLGTGVGSGIIINGEVVYGHDGYAGELGHTDAIHEGGRQCGCGRFGCLDVYASALGVAQTATEWLRERDEPSILRSIEDKITALDIFNAAEQGDALAIEIFDYTGRLLGRAFAGFAHFSSPEAFILFGGLVKAEKYLINAIEESMNEYLLPMWRNKINILTSSLNESDAAILGASALGW